MNELIAKVKELAAELVADAELQAEKGNKAAGTRAQSIFDIGKSIERI